jgi:glycosyltransferase involved in cell wall biosynthesis
VERERVRIIPMGVNRETTTRLEPRRPVGAPDPPFMVCIGNNFRHKNRLFALKLLAHLHQRGWNGRLILAGAHVEHGSSSGEEGAYLTTHRELAASVHELPAVDEDEKAWLYANGDAILYPTVYEGFGLIPFEAAQAGTPCLFAPQAALAETLPAEAATVVPWSPEETAERVLPLLHDGDERRQHIALVAAAAGRMQSQESAGRALLEVYEEAVRSPFREASAVASEAHSREMHVAKLQAEVESREAELGRWISFEERMQGLLGPDAHLPEDVQRALLALVTRPGLRGVLFALLRGLYRFGHKARRI